MELNRIKHSNWEIGTVDMLSSMKLFSSFQYLLLSCFSPTGSEASTADFVTTQNKKIIG